MIQLFSALAMLASGIYTGAAWYLAFVELPSLKTLPVQVARAHWAETVGRTPRYAASALVAASAALIVGRASPGSPWTWGAMAIFFVLPFTVAAVLPVQRRLLTPEGLFMWERHIDYWGKLHIVRVALGLAAMILFLGQMLRLPS